MDLARAHQNDPAGTSLSTAQRPGTARNHALDGLRGWLALAVCLYHGMLIPDSTQVARIIKPAIQQLSTTTAIIGKLAFTVLNGDLAVTIFFVMSGCVLLESLHRMDRLSAGRQAVVLAIRRMLRIYPALVFALALFWALFVLAERAFPTIFQIYFSPRQWLQNVTLWKISMYGAAWTLQVEILAVPFIFAAYWLDRMLGLAGLLLFVGFAILASGDAGLVFGLPLINGALPAFAGGFLIPGPLGKAIAQAASERGWLPIGLMLVLGRAALPYEHPAGALMQALFAFLFVSIVYWERSRGLDRVLTNRVSGVLGRLSYSFYLLNPIALELLLRALGALTGYPPARLDRGLLLGALATMVTLPVAAFSARHVEQPGIELARKLTRGLVRAQRPAPVT